MGCALLVGLGNKPRWSRCRCYFDRTTRWFASGCACSTSRSTGTWISGIFKLFPKQWVFYSFETLGRKQFGAINRSALITYDLVKAIAILFSTHQQLIMEEKSVLKLFRHSLCCGRCGQRLPTCYHQRWRRETLVPSQRQTECARPRGGTFSCVNEQRRLLHFGCRTGDTRVCGPKLEARRKIEGN